MKACIIFTFLTLSLHAFGQFSSGNRMTNNPKDQYMSYNNAYNIAAQGNVVHMVYNDQSGTTTEVSYLRSEDGGLTWSAPVALTPDDGFFSGFPSIACWNNEVHVVYADYNSINGEIYYLHSSNGGLTWSAPVHLTTTLGDSGYPSICVSNQVVHLVWIDDKYGNKEILYRRSVNSGLSWGNEIRLTNNTATSDQSSIAASGDYVQMVFQDDRTGTMNTYHMRSSDGGSSWSTETPLTNLSTSCDLPSVVTSGPLVMVSWDDRRDGFVEIYGRRSEDYGATWGSDMRLTNTPAVSTNSRMAAMGQYLCLVWHEDYTNNNWEINDRFSTDGGLTWAPRQAITNAPKISFRPAVAVSNERVHVTWHDERDGNQEVYYAQNPTGNPFSSDNTLGWAYRAGSTGNSSANSIVIDQAGSVVACGEFQNTVDFDPSGNLLNLTSAGVNDVFITKSNKAGAVQWAKRIGGPETDVCRSVVTDAGNNIYLCGSFEGTADFDPGPGVFNLTAGSQADAFLVKLDPEGNMVWAKKIGGDGYDYARGVTLNAAGQVCITGFFEETADFDPGPGVSPLTSNGAEDIFLAQYAQSGGYIRAIALGGSGSDAGRGIVADANGLLYVTGYFSDMVDFDLSLSSAIRTSAGLEDIFVLTLDAGLNFVKCVSVGGTESDRSNTMAIDVNRNLIVTGFFNGTADFNPGPAVANLTSNGLEDGFILKLNADGSYGWAQSFGGANEDEGRTLTMDGDGNIFGGGYFSSLADFYPGNPVSQLQSTGGFDAFILKLNATGAFQWLNQLSGTGAESCEALVAGQGKALYAAGYFSNTMDCDPSAHILKLTSADGTDLFLARVNTCAATTETISVTTCDFYTSPDGTIEWTESGIYLDTIINAAGCDSILTINLTIHHASETTVTDSACDSYTTPGGNTHTASGTYVEGWTDIYGCDSTVTYQLTIHKSTSHVSFEDACDVYIDPTGAEVTASGTYFYTLVNSQGCDSLLTINLQIHHTSSSTSDIFSCDSLVSPGGTMVWYASGSYEEIIPNAAGCDSIIHVNLTIGHGGQHEENIFACQEYVTPDGIVTITESGTFLYIIGLANGCDSVITIHATIEHINTLVDGNGSSLTAQQSGAQYQWLDCDQGYSIVDGATSQTFTPDHTAEYAVQITLNDCIDTSSCNLVTVVANHDPESASGVHVYPNPTSGHIYIQPSSGETIRAIYLQDMQGRQLSQIISGQGGVVSLEMPDTEGLYLLRIETLHAVAIQKVVVSH